jgi:hypothetical protein
MASAIHKELSDLRKTPDDWVGSSDWNMLLDLVGRSVPLGPVSYKSQGVLLQPAAGRKSEARATPGNPHPWQPREISGRKYRIRPGVVIDPLGQSWLPSNKNTEFEAPALAASGYYTWLRATTVGGANSSVSVTALEYQAGSELPAAIQWSADGATPPTAVYLPLFYVTTTATAIDHVEQLVDRSQQLALEVSDVQCESRTRLLTWRGI